VLPEYTVHPAPATV